MIKKITQSLKLRHLCFVSVLLLSGLSFAQSISKHPIYEDKENEVIEKRDLFAKHFLNEDGSYTATVATGPIHYENDGVFETIETTIHSFSSGAYTYANTENLMASYFGATAHTGVKNVTKEGEVLEFLSTTMHWEVAGLKVGEKQSDNVPVTITVIKRIIITYIVL